MSDVAVPVAHEGASQQAGLADRLAGLRRRAGLQANDRALLLVGSFFLPLGVVLVLLGWYGASHTTRLFEEIPYLISGGLLGIVVTVIGGFCYFGYWLTRLVATARELLDALLRIEDRLDAAAAPRAVPVPVPVPATPVEAFVATRTGAMYHRPECPTVAKVSELRGVDASHTGLRPCRICIPELAP